jgi:predicted Rossmann fold flavoprotein
MYIPFKGMIFMKNRVVVIGGGASGMMAAAVAASRGLETHLLEKNDKLGKKLYLTGKGRCNVTNECEIEEMIENTPGNGPFLYHSLYSFDNYRLRELLNDMGVPTKVERGNRVFPVSDKSSDVIKALASYMKKHGVNVRLRKPVSDIKASGSRVEGVYTDDGDLIKASSVIVATGGLSYPSTGCTGDGYKWAKGFGHTIVPLRPSLIPLETKEKWVKEVQGLTLKNVNVRALTKRGKAVGEEFGEMLFTHFGVSGPVILTLSRFVYDYIKEGVVLKIDLKPALSMQKLDLRMLRDFTDKPNRKAANCLDDLLPKSLAEVIMKKSGIDIEKQTNQITREERQSLLSVLKGLELEVSKVRPIKEAVITAGGVSTKEVDPATMESRIIKGLYFTGEVLDVDALTGGFNLQIAFSTGYLAGSSCS